MRVRVLGAAGGYPYGGHACSGFLLGASSLNVLMDCGPGVALRLLERMRAEELDAVILTHLHPDHVLDLIPLGYALMTEWIARRKKRRIRLYMPEGGLSFLESFAGLFGHKRWIFDDAERGPGYDALRCAVRDGRDWMFEVFDASEFRPGADIDLGALRLATIPADHAPGAVCLRIDHDGSRLVYTGDTRPFDGLPEFCRNADLLIAEGHFSGSHPPSGVHMTPRQAGQLAQSAGAKCLLLTHIAAAEDGASALREVKSEFDGPVDLALERAEIML